jgi:hypothetical protein
MSGLGFIHLGFLAAAGAVALPVLIHLLFRQRSRTVMIGSVRFLQNVVREHRRRRRLRQWLLLALRTLAVLLLALLFARPYLDQASQRGQQQEHVLLLDRSASMRSGEGGETAWRQAVEDAQAELKQIDENAIVHVGLCDAAGIVEVSPAEFPGDAAAGNLPTDLGLALSWGGDLLRGSLRGERRVVLFTDLQRRGTERTPVIRLPEGVRLEIRDVGRQVPGNLAILSAAPLRTEIRPGDAVTLRLVVRNYGPLPVRDARVSIKLEGPGEPIVLDQALDLPGDGTQVADIALPIEQDGVYRGAARIDRPDELDWDNTRFVAFEARRPDRLLLVDGQEGRSVFGNETYYLETALQLRPKAETAGRRSFEVERIVWEAGTGFPDLAGFRALLLANVRRLSPTDLERLKKYVTDGGCLVLFAGDQSTASLTALAETGLLPGVPAAESVAGAFRVEQWDREHPVLSPFNDPQQGDLRRLTARRLWPLATLADDSRVLAQMGEHAVLVERPLGKGMCLFMATTADREWTDWPRTRLYVPLVRQLMAYATGQLAQRPAVETQTIDERGLEPGIVDDDGRLIVRNIDPAESDPAKVTVETLLAATGGAPQGPTEDETARTAALVSAPDALRPDEMWTLLAWLLLAVLAVEVLVASRVHA